MCPPPPPYASNIKHKQFHDLKGIPIEQYLQFGSFDVHRMHTDIATNES